MPYPIVDPKQVGTLLDKVVDQLSVIIEGDAPVDIITFAEDPRFLGRKLFPRQRLMLKIYYRLPLTEAELQDTKALLCADQKYAKLYFPGICEHHITGKDCGKDACHLSENLHDWGVLSDQEIRARLSAHHAHILLNIIGRGGSKTAIGALINLYEIYRHRRIQNPQERYGLFLGSRIGTLNVATDEKQAGLLFDFIKMYMDGSPWFQKLSYRALETQIEYGGGIYSRSLHSNSSSVRGNRAFCINVDEICHFNKTMGRLSDRAMMAAVMPSTALFKGDSRIVMGSSPLNKDGVAWEYASAAIERKSPHIIYFQFACWEVNPLATRENSPEIRNAYALDEQAADMEYGGQWADQAGAFMPQEAILACANKELGPRTHGDRSVRYTISVDLSKKRDRTGLIVCHYDRERGKVIVDRVEQFDPKQTYDDMVVGTKHGGEIDLGLIERHIRLLTDQYKFRFNSITFDQFNSQDIIRRLQSKYGEEIVEEFTWTDRSNREVFSNLRTQIVQGGIEYPHNHELLRQLGSLVKSIKPSGTWKVEAIVGEHDDLADPLAIAVYMCLLNALGMTSGVMGMRNAELVERELSSPIPELRHHKDCTDAYCVWGCPVAEALAAGAVATVST